MAGNLNNDQRTATFGAPTPNTLSVNQLRMLINTVDPEVCKFEKRQFVTAAFVDSLPRWLGKNFTTPNISATSDGCLGLKYRLWLIHGLLEADADSSCSSARHVNKHRYVCTGAPVHQPHVTVWDAASSCRRFRILKSAGPDSNITLELQKRPGCTQLRFLQDGTRPSRRP